MLKIRKHKHTNIKAPSYLVLVQLTVLVLLLPLLLKGDDDETDEDVHHEEGNDDNVDDEEDGDLDAVVVDGTHVLPVGVDGLVEQTAWTNKAHGQKKRSLTAISDTDTSFGPQPCLRGPPLECGDGEKSHHGHEDVVKVEVTVVPDPLFHHGQRCVPVVVENVGTSVI